MLYMIPITVILLLFAGLVLDGGTALAARGRATDVADQAARSAANALSQTSLRAAGPEHPRIDPSAAQAAGRHVLHDAGATGTITVHGSQSVAVTAHIHARTAILSAIGITDASGTATATATILTGTTTPDPVSAGQP